ncbi:hypothetical protein DOK67_0002054 [Enterococcus sp. DIV0212c]|uniref:LytR/AlgR family response regulator transcription factor n=1 Tax=Enterococcus sp. DIV0212c TaxID=2230867 RepID=UPI001A9C012E|nr:LytTR family transcriptional regulator DNA-binding domain-containing protein [Enterococcus sp. DIV0212c]MBO1354769.1 LytTR family transcriptional regulator DNA-binding domain-containing protein [Enterococcus sp. DIV0212c]
MTLTAKVYIIEDDNEYRKGIVHSLQSYHSRFVHFEVSPIDNHLFFMEDLQTLRITDTDIFIFDIDLKTTFSGIDLAIEVRKKNTKCMIIFLTSLEDQAISVINSNIFPLGYLIKNLSAQINLTESVQTLLTKVENNLRSYWREDQDVVMLTNGTENVYLNCKEILYIESLKGMRGRILIKTLSEDILIDGRIGKIKTMLTQPYFLTSLQSYIINLSAITFVDRRHGMITFSDGQELLVGIKIIDKIKKIL